MHHTLSVKSIEMIMILMESCEKNPKDSISDSEEDEIVVKNIETGETHSVNELTK
jgi:hypothetical protein